MSKPVKLSDVDKKWNRRGDRCQSRCVDIRDERQRFLIVCEGTKTEPTYFEAIQKLLPPNVATIEIYGEGANTLSLVDLAREKRESRKDGDYSFDQVWVVFDRDSFPPDNFDNAIKSTNAEGMRCAWSNEAFELWYILHFEYRNSAMARQEYQKKLQEFLGEPYKKNAVDMYEKLAKFGDQKRAIGWARKLFEDFDGRRIPPSRSNPCTTVYLLVEELNKFMPVDTQKCGASL
jgi:hypothetical protein